MKNNLGNGTQRSNDTLSVLLNPYYQNQSTPFIGWDFVGNDLIANGMVGTYDECIQRCLDTANCAMVTLRGLASLTNTSTQTCYLKTITNLGWGFRDGWQSYVLPQTSSAGANLDTHCLPCPKGAAALEGWRSNSRVVGQTSLPGSSTCFLASINSDMPFALQNEQDNSYLSGAGDVAVESSSPALLTFNADTTAIVSASTGLSFCLDDLGGGFLGYAPCSNSIDQEFIYLPLTHQIVNPNDPNFNCLTGNSTDADSMALCDGGGNPGSDPQQRWTVVPACSPGQFSPTGLAPCSPCPPGMPRMLRAAA